MSPSGASQQKAEGACATRNGAAQPGLSFVTQKRDGECAKAAPREAQHTWETPGKDWAGVGTMRAALGPSEPVLAGEGDAAISVWRGPGMQGQGRTGWLG